MTDRRFSFPSLDEMKELMEYAKILAQVPNYAQLGGPGGIFAILLTAKELDIGLMYALNGGIYNLPGRSSPKGTVPPRFVMGAHTMNMMILREGHTIEQLSLNDHECILKGTRGDNGSSLSVKFTLDQAKRAGIVRDYSAWVTNIQDMLWKSALSKLARRHFSDVIGNCYGEFDFHEADYEEISEDQGKKIETKRRKPKQEKELIEQKTDENLENLLEETKISPILQDFYKKYDLSNPNSQAYSLIKELSEIKQVEFEYVAELCMDNEEEFIERLNKRILTEKQS